jgi:hypothetical protein
MDRPPESTEVLEGDLMEIGENEITVLSRTPTASEGSTKVWRSTSNVIRIPEDFGGDQRDDLLDNIGLEGKFYVRDGMLVRYDFGYITSPDDREILNIANEFSQKTGLPKTNFRRVFWSDIFPGQSLLEHVGFSFGRMPRVTLPLSLLGKLQPEEWGTLIASSLIFEKELKGRLRMLRLAVQGLLYLGVWGVGIFAAFDIIVGPYRDWTEKRQVSPCHLSPYYALFSLTRL